MAEAHTKLTDNEMHLHEQHRKQLQEVNQHHKKELDKQMELHKEDIQRKENNHKEEVHRLEDEINSLKQEISGLKTSRHSLERQKSAMVKRIQTLMQSHCNEALNIIGLENGANDKAQINGQVDVYNPPYVPQPQRNQSMPYNQSMNYQPAYNLPEPVQYRPPSRTKPQAEPLNLTLDYDDVDSVSIHGNKGPGYHSNYSNYVNSTLQYQPPPVRRSTPNPSTVMRDEDFDQGMVSDVMSTTSGKEGSVVAPPSVAQTTTSYRSLPKPIDLSSGYSSVTTPHHISSLTNTNLLDCEVDNICRDLNRSNVSGLDRTYTGQRDNLIEDVHNDLPSWDREYYGVRLPDYLMDDLRVEPSDAASVYSNMSGRLNEQEERQQELQEYIKLLLTKPTGVTQDSRRLSDDVSTVTGSTQYKALPAHSPPQRLNSTSTSQQRAPDPLTTIGQLKSRDIPNNVTVTRGSGQPKQPTSMDDLMTYIKDLQESGFLPAHSALKSAQNIAHNGDITPGGESEVSINGADTGLVSTNHAPQYSRATAVAREKLYERRPPKEKSVKPVSNRKIERRTMTGQTKSATRRPLSSSTTSSSHPVWR